MNPSYNDPQDDEDKDIDEFHRICNLEAANKKLTELLAYVLQYLDDEGEGGLGEYFPERKGIHAKIRAWWATYKIRNGKMMEKEKVEEMKKKLRKQALAKLSQDEIKALGKLAPL